MVPVILLASSSCNSTTVEDSQNPGGDVELAGTQTTAEEQPELPMPSWSVSEPARPEIGPGHEAFELLLDSIYFDGECLGEGRRASDGIRLILTGAVTHNLEDLVHRATLTGILYARFSDDVAVLRASGGTGFDPEVDSDEPWRPGQERRFRVETRPIDPIYCEYQPSELVGAIHISARTPLGAEVDAVVQTLSPSWTTVQGAFMELDAYATADVRLEGAFERVDLEEGTAASVRFVRRGRGFVEVADRGLGWVSMDDLRVPREWNESSPTRSSQIELVQGGVFATLSSFVLDQGGLAARAIFRSEGQESWRCSPNDLRLMDTSGGETRAEADELLEAACRRPEPGALVEGRVLFEIEQAAAPLAVGYRRGGSAWLHIDRTLSE